MKGKALFHFGGLEEWIFGGAAHSGGVYTGYPPGFPLLQAASFHAMGTDDVVTQNLNYWFFTLGFAAAVGGLLAPRVRGIILLPALLLMLLFPDTALISPFRVGLSGRGSRRLSSRWRRCSSSPGSTSGRAGSSPPPPASRPACSRRSARVSCSEACFIVAGGAASWADRRWAWPRLAALGAAAFALSLPWRAWVALQGYRSDVPEGGFFAFLLYDVDRARAPALARGTGDVELRPWLAPPAAAVVAAVLAFLAGARRGAVFTLAFIRSTLAANAWVTLTNPVTDLARLLVESGDAVHG